MLLTFIIGIDLKYWCQTNWHSTIYFVLRRLLGEVKHRWEIDVNLFYLICFLIYLIILALNLQGFCFMSHHQSGNHFWRTRTGAAAETQEATVRSFPNIVQILPPWKDGEIVRTAWYEGEDKPLSISCSRKWKYPNLVNNYKHKYELL